MVIRSSAGGGAGGCGRSSSRWGKVEGHVILMTYAGQHLVVNSSSPTLL